MPIAYPRIDIEVYCSCGGWLCDQTEVLESDWPKLVVSPCKKCLAKENQACALTDQGNKLPASLIKEGKEYLNGCRIFDNHVENLSRDDLMAVLALQIRLDEARNGNERMRDNRIVELLKGEPHGRSRI